MLPRTSTTSNISAINDTIELTSKNVRTAACTAEPTFSGLKELKSSVTTKEFCRTIDVTLEIFRVSSANAVNTVGQQ
ncbi:hypothetical protein HMI55_002901, partial [Coelomomyces lativittatus]